MLTSNLELSPLFPCLQLYLHGLRMVISHVDLQFCSFLKRGNSCFVGEPFQPWMIVALVWWWVLGTAEWCIGGWIHGNDTTCHRVHQFGSLMSFEQFFSNNEALWLRGTRYPHTALLLGGYSVGVDLLKGFFTLEEQNINPKTWEFDLSSFYFLKKNQIGV